MNKKIVVLAVALLAMAMLATPIVNATPSEPVSGTQILTGFTPLGASPKGKSDNVVTTATVETTWTGDIAGSTSYEGILMIHNFVPPTGIGPGTTVNIHERIFFTTVTVLGKSGSLTMEVSANLARGQNVFRWTILSGTGELTNLHGNGIYYLVGAPIYAYEGQVHFDP